MWVYKKVVGFVFGSYPQFGGGLLKSSNDVCPYWLDMWDPGSQSSGLHCLPIFAIVVPIRDPPIHGQSLLFSSFSWFRRGPVT